MDNTNTGNDISLVSECSATACMHNEQQHCTAGQITITFMEGQPSCGTYTEDEGMQSDTLQSMRSASI